MADFIPENRTNISTDKTDPPAERRDLGDRTWTKNHFINIRLSIPLFFTSVYLTIVAGTERRSPDRLRQERGKHPLATLGNLLCFGYSGVVLALALSALAITAIVLVLRQMFDIELVLN